MYDGNCCIKLCQFQHSAKKDSEEIIDKVIKSSGNYSKYNELNENKQLLGVDMEKIRDDYNNMEGRKNSIVKNVNT